MKLGKKQEMFTSCVAKLIQYAEDNGYRCRLREATRTYEQQEIYIKQGKSKTRDSQHLKSLAVDIYFTQGGVLVTDKQALQEIGDYWESLGDTNQWGGNWTSFVDTPHYEMR